MKLKVIGKQPNSRNCFVCGMENQCGLRSRFYALEDGSIMARFTPANEHQSYPERLHGGIAAAILDETIGRAIINHHRNELWGVTLDFSIKFRQAVPLGQELTVLARITRENKRTFEGSGELLLADGTIAIEGNGRYLKLALDQITTGNFADEEWGVIEQPIDPKSVAF